jgi:hypothetical protein
MACLDDLRTEIQGTDCIGASRTTINSNFTKIATAVCTLSTSPMQVVDSNTIDLTYTTNTRTLTADVTTGIISSQQAATETSANDQLLLLQSSSSQLKKITVGSAFYNNYFKVTETYPVSSTDDQMKVTSVYVNNIGNPTATGTSLTNTVTNIWRRFNNVEQNYGNFAQVKKFGGSNNATYVELSAGYYEIRATAGIYFCETHCVSLLTFNPVTSSAYTSVAQGTVQYSEWSGNPDTSYSTVVGRFYFPEITGVALFHAFSGSSSALLGSRNFRHIINPVPSWLQTYIPRSPTAQMEIIKLG